MLLSPTVLWSAVLAALLAALLGAAVMLASSRRKSDGRRIARLEADLAEAHHNLLGLSHFKAALDRTLDALYIFTADSRELVYVNQGCAEQLGYAVADLLGHHLRIIKTEGGEEAFLRHGMPLVRGPQRSVTYESVHRRRDGSAFPVEIFLQYQDAENGQPGRFVAIARDISARCASEAALRNATAQIEAILANIPVGISIISPDRRIARVNQAFCSIYGGAESEVLGRSTEDFYNNPQDFADISQVALPMVRQGKTFAADFHMRRLNGTRDLWCRLTGRLIDPQEPLLGFIWVHDDITERRRIEQDLRDRHEFFEQVFRSNSAIKMLLDPADGRIVYVNPAAAAFYGYGLERLKNMWIGDIDDMPPEGIKTAIAQARSGERQQFQFRHRLASGETREVDVYASPIQVQGRTYLFCIVHDVTERVHSEQELARRTIELQKSNAELEQFAYVASHDLRQPLRMVNSYLTLLARQLGDGLDKDCREYLNFACDGAQRMDRLILDLLSYSRVGRQDAAMEAVPLRAVLEDALLPMQGVLQEHGVRLSLPDHLPTVMGSQQELTRLFQNLLDNALKYRDPAREPEIAVTCERKNEAWEIAVSDNGIGIEPEYFDRVFGLFQRLHGPGQYDGTGIGLAICRKIVEHHGGRIWVESWYGQGSRFLFTLPTVPFTISGRTDAQGP